MKTLDEAIKNYEKKAEELYKAIPCDGCPFDKCKEEHRQLAEWLKELKAYREAEKEIEQELVNWNDIDNGKCRGLFLATSIIQHYKNEEVNADNDRAIHVYEKFNFKKIKPTMYLMEVNTDDSN